MPEPLEDSDKGREEMIKAIKELRRKVASERQSLREAMQRTRTSLKKKQPPGSRA